MINRNGVNAGEKFMHTKSNTRKGIDMMQED